MNSYKRKISSFAEVVTGGTPSTSIKEYWNNGTIPWLNSGELNKDRINYSDNFITDLGLSKSSAKLMPPKTVLIALTGATTGKTALLNIDACANQSVTGILPSNEHDSEYLYFFLKTQRERILGQAWGGAQPHINQKYVKDYLIPLPPLEVQQQIATILNKIEKLIKQRKESIGLTDEFLNHMFLHMFGKRIGKERRLEEVIDIQNGQVNPNDLPYREMYHIGGANIEAETGKLINLRKAKDEKLISGKYYFNPTFILYSKIRPYLNKVTIPPFEGVCSADIYPLKPKDPDECNLQFLKFELKSKRFLLYANNNSDRANIPKINRNALNNYKVIIPPIDLQKKFSRIVDTADNLKSFFEESLLELESLNRVLCHQAFIGKLDVSGVLFTGTYDLIQAKEDVKGPSVEHIDHNKLPLAAEPQKVKEFYVRVERKLTIPLLKEFILVKYSNSKFSFGRLMKDLQEGHYQTEYYQLREFVFSILNEGFLLQDFHNPETGNEQVFSSNHIDAPVEDQKFRIFLRANEAY